VKHFDFSKVQGGHAGTVKQYLRQVEAEAYCPRAISLSHTNNKSKKKSKCREGIAEL